MGVRLGFASQMDGANVTQANPISMDCQITLTSGAGLLRGQPVCIDYSNLGPKATVGVPFQVVPVTNSSAGPPLGIFQGNTFTNSPGAAGGSVTYDITVQAYGFGQILVGGRTTSVTVGGVLTVNPGFTAGNNYAMQVVPVENVLVQSTVYYVGAAIATGTSTAIGTVISTAGSTSIYLVNAFINTIA